MKSCILLAMILLGSCTLYVDRVAAADLTIDKNSPHFSRLLTVKKQCFRSATKNKQDIRLVCSCVIKGVEQILNQNDNIELQSLLFKYDRLKRKCGNPKRLKNAKPKK